MKKLISKIKSIWNKFMLSLNWPYVSNKDHGIFRKKLYQFLKMNNKFNNEKIYFKDNDNVMHELEFKYYIYHGFDASRGRCRYIIKMFMLHKITQESFLTPETIDVYGLIKKSNTVDFEDVYSTYLFGYNDEPEILKYRLFRYNSVVNFDELNRQMDILIMKYL